MPAASPVATETTATKDTTNITAVPGKGTPATADTGKTSGQTTGSTVAPATPAASGGITGNASNATTSKSTTTTPAASGSTATTGSKTTTTGSSGTTASATTTTTPAPGSTNTTGSNTSSGVTKATGSNVATAPTTVTTNPATGTGSKSATTPSGSTASPAPTTPATTTKVVSAYKYSAPIVLRNQSNLTISGDSINGGSVPCISLSNCHNIHITNCRLQNGTTINSTGVNIANCTGITVDNCMISKVSTGVYAQDSQTINVNTNQFLNMMGPYPRGAYVQFNNVSGSGNRIQNNKGENVAGQSNPEDGISLYKCNGLPADPILVSGNMLRGGGPSTTGAGITVGDQGGSYQTVTNNIVVNTGTDGMQVAGGTYINMSNNTIYGTATSISHVGLGFGNYSGLPCNNITMGGNKIKWMCGKASDLAYYPKGTTSVEKDESYQTSLTKPAGWGTNILGAPLNASVLPATLIKL
ncbi:MAG TPA: right-handed parallel beta-helix repeat-containing protein [Mucilaginibacter sp.]|nr:right-handed parallel beta-helix repeat-containing protein [Mucilaginibacter sp.]